MSNKSKLLLFIQFLTIGALLVTLTLPASIPSYIFIVGGCIVGGIGLTQLRSSYIRVQPEPAEKAKLITTGIYARIRHPLYLAVILFAFGVLLAPFTWWRLIIFVILVDTLRIKMSYEETLLGKKFGTNYTAYKNNTKKLIPFIY